MKSFASLQTWRSASQRTLPVLPFGVTWLAVGFAVRTTTASIVALYIAFWLDFEEPKWAPMTVWIVAQASRGMSLSKSQYRLLGTMTGAVAGVTLIAAFAQAPELFLVALAAWLAICTAASTALRNFRSYGAVLAGYTAAIIGIAASSQPGTVFDIAVARVSNIGIGILTEALFAAILAPGAPMAELHRRLDAFVKQTVAICGRALRGEDNSVQLRQLFATALQLDTAGEYAAASSVEARLRLGHLRATIAAALAQLAAAQSLREHVVRHSSQADSLPTDPFLIDTEKALDAAESLIAPQSFDTLRDQLREAAIAAEIVDRRSASPALQRVLLLHRLDALVAGTRETLTRRTLFLDPAASPSRMTFRFHIDKSAVLRNGIRAFIALLLAATFWIATAWSSGGAMLVIVAVVCALFSTRPNPVVSGLGFLKGAGVAVVAAAICNLILLPAVSDFAMLAALTAPFLVTGGIAMRLPRTAPAAAGFTIFFWDLVTPENMVRAEALGFFNESLALLLGIACGTLVFALLPPARRLAMRRRLHAAVRQDLKTIGRNPGLWSGHAWLVRMADHFSQQLTTNASVPESLHESDLRGMLAALTIGHAAIALHNLKDGTPLDARISALVLARLGNGHPRRLACACESAARRFVRLGIKARGGEVHHPLRRAALLDDIAQSAIAHAEFLEGDG